MAWSEDAAGDMIARQHITGLVLAGGRGSRMGGADKGLQIYQGQPLALHALARLRPQVGPLMINANRNLAAYAALGAPVWPDPLPDFPGPLGGLLAGLQHCETPYLATVPCDTPRFPADLVERLAHGLVQAQADVAMAVTREIAGPTPGGAAEGPRAQPVFALVRADRLNSLLACLQSGERRAAVWMRQQRCVEVLFGDSAAFTNANTLADLQALRP